MSAHYATHDLFVRPEGGQGPGPVTNDRPRRPPIWINWRLLATSGVVLGFVWVDIGPFAVAVWAGLLVSITVHEAAHAWCAARSGVGATKMVVGVGPAVLRTRVGETTVAIRVVPLLGWMEPTIDLAEVPRRYDNRLHRKGLHHRMALVYLAGPAASALLGLFLVVPGGMLLRDHQRFDKAQVFSDTTFAGSALLEPARLAVHEIVAVIPVPGREASQPTASTSEASGETTSSTESGDQPRLVTAVGFTAEGNTIVEDYGTTTIPILLGFLNLGIAGFNLLPVWGLDGYGVLSQLIESRRTTHPRSGVRFRTLLTATAIAFTVGAVVLVAQALWNDLWMAL